ncbi:hypothetical protein GO988_01560 [Hymenobacter sp. HMF4947]|uniref:Uncharacterized protein n=1 Tax=Hymenobacter ginkgonis TaxID=2682976 RepID=A0A7K1T9C0_9BACT|nr:hypothetical protein [Hymenobacter ginkgonis]MVN75006.1 hypothetical protein [Hymenobacter ginkgonis]
MEKTAKDFAHIKGWGIDADPKNDPTYPYKHRTNGEHAGYIRPDIPQQPLTVEVLHSNERPNITAVFGTSVPPSGLSGILRRYAFKFSENEYGHWLPLLLADRVNVVEGILDDLVHGHIPNLFAEKGGKSDWKFNRKSQLLKAGIGTALGIATIVLLSQKKGKKAKR